MVIRVAGIVEDSIVDGPGMRLTVFTQGCPHHCPGCHNLQTHDPAGGTEMFTEDILRRIGSNVLLSGVTLSGGDPFEQPEACLELAKGSHDLGLNVWAYTGYLFEQLLSDSAKRALLEEVDVLVDGPFIMAQKSYDCRWRGSKNQRLIGVKASLRQGKIVLLED